MNSAMTDREKLKRLAFLSEGIARRLYEVQTWTAHDKRQHKSDLAERDVLLASVEPGYFPRMTRSRVTGEVRPAPAPWKLRVVAWLAQRI